MLDSVKGDRQKGERDNGKELERQSKHQRNIITVDYSSTTSGKNDVKDDLRVEIVNRASKEFICCSNIYV